MHCLPAGFAGIQRASGAAAADGLAGFHEQAILCGYLGDDLIAAPIVELFKWVAANPAPAATGDPFSCETLGIEMTGRVATAKVRESDHHGVVIGHFHLLKVGERWSIVSKLWDAEP